MRHSALSVGDAFRAAPLLPAVCNVAVVLATMPAPARGPGPRALHLAFTGGYLVAMGLGAGVLADGGARLAPRRAWVAPSVLFAAAAAPAWPMLEEDAQQLETIERVAASVAVGLFAGCLPLAFRIAAGRRWLGVPAALAAIAAAVANHFVLLINYPGSHLVLAFASVALGAVALAGTRVPRLARAAGAALLAAACLWAGFALGVRPSPRVEVELSKDESASLHRFFAPLYGPTFTPSLAAVPEEQRVWFASRAERPPVPPTAGKPRVEPLLVLLVTVDAMRSDVWTSASAAERFLHLKALAAESVEFVEHRAAGSSTVPSMSALLSGLYYSQRYSTQIDLPRGKRHFLTRDTAFRLCDLLERAGVATATAPSTEGLEVEHGIVGGCKSVLGGDSRRDQPSRVVMPRLAEWAATRGAERRAFGFAHMMDAHAPYNLAGTDGTQRERYERELALVDAEVGALVRRLRDAGVWDRTVLVFTADHGESFGDHGTKYHGANVYEEPVRVPLFVRIPGVAPRVVGEPVGGIDVTLTILDLFDVETPGAVMGESLVPLALGRDEKPTRPIVLDTPRRQAIVFSDGLKVVFHPKEGTFELYDLRADPGETENLVEEHPEASARVGALLAFFEAHTYRKLGYTVSRR